MKKRVLSMALILAVCLTLLPTAALADYDGAGSGIELVGQSLDQPVPLPDHLAKGADPGWWLLYDYDHSKVLEITRDEWDESTYTVLEGMEFTVWQNPDWQGTVSGVYVEKSGSDEGACFYSAFIPDGLEDMRYMPPTTITFGHDMVTPDGTAIDLAEMGATYNLYFEVNWFDEEYECFLSSQLTKRFQVIPAVAYASTQTVDIDGKAVEFQMYSIKDANGNDTNYVKVRDVALALDGTAAQFNVGWDGNINLETGKAYTTRNGQENSTPYSGDQPFACATSATNVDGEIANLTAFVITDAGGSGSTYYKLRDLGAALGFTVDWSVDRGIYIETK